MDTLCFLEHVLSFENDNVLHRKLFGLHITLFLMGTLLVRRSNECLVGNSFELLPAVQLRYIGLITLIC